MLGFLQIAALLISISVQKIPSTNSLDQGCKDGTLDILLIDESYKAEKIFGIKASKGLYIDIDPNNKSKNFISTTEYFFRTQSKNLDTTNVGYVKDWEMHTANQKLEIVEQKKIQKKEYADKIHFETNQGQQIVSIINANRKMVDFPSICGLPVVVLQAKNEFEKWKTIRYVEFATCGNCYGGRILSKRHKLDLIVQLPENGDFQTKLRFKMLYKRGFIYSNEFDYSISKCDFIEKPDNKKICSFCSPTPESMLKVEPKQWGGGWH